jgi:glucose-1-phosphate thymidylyltransferase
LGALSTSKEILPVRDLVTTNGSPVAVGEYLMRQFRAAAIRDVVVIRRNEKTDIPQFFSNPRFSDFNLTDLVIAPTPGTAHTLDKAWALIKDRPVAMGFPDIILQPVDMCQQLVERMHSTGCDICLSLVPVQDATGWDLLQLDGDRVVSVAIKAGTASSAMGWASAVWQPSFSRFMHGFLPAASGEQEVYVGHVIQAALDAGLHARAVTFSSGFALDIGVPERLAQVAVPLIDR